MLGTYNSCGCGSCYEHIVSDSEIVENVAKYEMMLI
jgi:hypothetical protein